MSSYSLNGYLAALQMRGGISLLVEGSNDVKIVARVVIELEHLHRVDTTNIAIDPVSLIEDSELPYGNRTAVEYVVILASKEMLPLAGFVDREFRDFEVHTSLVDHLHEHKNDASLFWTRGHSIENYFFCEKYITAYLRMKFPELLTRPCFSLISSHILDIIEVAAAVSLSARDLNMLDKCRGICRYHYWSFSESQNIQFDYLSFSKVLEGRGATPAQIIDFCIRYKDYLHRLASCSDSKLRRWIAHGHIGWEFLWSGIASLLYRCGTTKEVVESVCQGHYEEKLRHLADYWARDISDNAIESPVFLWQWLEASL